MVATEEELRIHCYLNFNTLLSLLHHHHKCLVWSLGEFPFCSIGINMTL